MARHFFRKIKEKSKEGFIGIFFVFDKILPLFQKN
jgi:hypothetical protein